MAVQTTKGRGDAGEARALAHLQRHGLVLVQRNYRVARGPRARGGEVDLVMRERDGTLVFVEVRVRSDGRFGGAAARGGAGGGGGGAAPAGRPLFVAGGTPSRRRLRDPPPCRFDVVAVE